MTTYYGKFSGNPKTEWLTDSAEADRDMKLLEDFWYEDPKGRTWEAPSGSVVNGASVPRDLWAIVGTPYTGDYRKASIVHDVACDNPGIPRGKRMICSIMPAWPEGVPRQARQLSHRAAQGRIHVDL